MEKANALSAERRVVMSFATPDMFTDYVIDGKGIHKQTNADRIRAMSDEELAEFLEAINRDYDISYGEYFSTKAGDFIFSKNDLAKEILKWLQSEAE